MWSYNLWWVFPLYMHGNKWTYDSTYCWTKGSCWSFQNLSSMSTIHRSTYSSCRPAGAPLAYTQASAHQLTCMLVISNFLLSRNSTEWHIFKLFFILILLRETKIHSILGQHMGKEREKERNRERTHHCSNLKLYSRQQLACYLSLLLVSSTLHINVAATTVVTTSFSSTSQALEKRSTPVRFIWIALHGIKYL